jgi:crotonobetainyl-CoA:carnitine CoA-transferase CaiB-like acyl-CoA transferase
VLSWPQKAVESGAGLTTDQMDTRRWGQKRVHPAIRAEGVPRDAGTVLCSTLPSAREEDSSAKGTGGQYIDASIHEACALTTEAAIANYVYRGEVVRRQTGRHHAAGPTPRTQFRAKDGTYVCALVAGRLTPKYIGELADLLDTNGMGGDLRDPKYQDPAVIAANTSHIIDDLVANFIASLPAEEVYHAAQQRGFTWGAVRAPEALLNDPHLNDRGFWKEVAHPELGRSFVYPGEAAIYNGSPWRISRRAPLIGEHNVEIFCTELGLSRNELSVLAENRVI